MYRYFKLSYYREDVNTALCYGQLSSAVSHWCIVLVPAGWSSFCPLQLLFLRCWNHVFPHAPTAVPDLLSISVLQGSSSPQKGPLACYVFFSAFIFMARIFQLCCFSTADSERRCESVSPALSIDDEIMTSSFSLCVRFLIFKFFSSVSHISPPLLLSFLSDGTLPFTSFCCSLLMFIPKFVTHVDFDTERTFKL